MDVAARIIPVRPALHLTAAVVAVAACARVAWSQPNVATQPPKFFASNVGPWERLSNGVERLRLVGRRPASPTELVAYRERYPATFMCDSASIGVHRHIGTLHLQVLSGTLMLGMGTTVDHAKAQAYGPGSFIALPSGTSHYEWSRGALEIHVDAVGEPRVAPVRRADGSVDQPSPSTFTAAPCGAAVRDAAPAPPNGLGEWNGNRLMLTDDNPSMGLVAFRVRYPEAVPPVYHYHYGTEHVTIWRGTLIATFGDAGMDSSKAVAYGPGSFIEIPAGMPHAEWITPGLEAHVEFVGPTTATPLDPKTGRPLRDPEPPSPRPKRR
jgi:quercetin dioxygenase-like cupin family protein